MRKFKVGDKVRLISGSDEMTVCSVFGLRLVECSWIGKEGTTYKNSFRPEYLELSENTEELSKEEISQEKVSQK
ncbi:hypothetical protein QQ008_06240 [Fulvivirgaceae bacterium BMA10]|uniref:DUF2158 domain-containing protein n=1 Tax=Splendidivirga corallicola TaxID=3051826 RepID=A0ABT8KL36_9BACT|nr:hypothetical protein [Fulvivirgaceae bacterium BMA10]